MDTYMRRADLEGLPVHAFPAGYGMRSWTPDDLRAWIALQAPEFEPGAVDEAVFAREFGTDAALHAERIFFLIHEGEAIGTIAAWFGDDPAGPRPGARIGRIHWVAIAQAFRGRGLAKPMLAFACERLRAFGHRAAYLMTDTELVPAVGIYLDFGFEPVVGGEPLRAAWDAVLARLGAKWQTGAD